MKDTKTMKLVAQSLHDGYREFIKAAKEGEIPPRVGFYIEKNILYMDLLYEDIPVQQIYHPMECIPDLIEALKKAHLIWLSESKDIRH